MRTKYFKKGDWGAGLDYLLKEFWDGLDRIRKDNLEGQHDKKLINSLFPKVSLALKNSVDEMKRLCGGSSKGLTDWIRKAKNLQSFSKQVKTFSDKVIFIDSVVQFLRATSWKDDKRGKKRVQKKIKRSGNSAIKGVAVCCVGEKIEGFVKIVLSEKDFPKIKKGDILVSKETSSSFLPVMKKAKVFITDEGGILCHTAIVAREMKKPCIVGTKIASRVLKDGDLVEVDSERGRVRVLKK